MTTAALLVLEPVLGSLLHLGSLHTYEKVLVALVALGPFVVLAVLVVVVRRRDQRAELDEGDGPTSPEG
jgi:hypothetical protein